MFFALTTTTDDLGVLPAKTARKAAKQYANQLQCTVTLRNPTTDKVVDTIKPDAPSSRRGEPTGVKMSLSKWDQKYIRGCLEVTASKPSRMGLSDRYVPAGSVGYVKAFADDKRLIFWPWLSREYKGDHRQGSHDSGDLRATGKRG